MFFSVLLGRVNKVIPIILITFTKGCQMIKYYKDISCSYNELEYIHLEYVEHLDCSNNNLSELSLPGSVVSISCYYNDSLKHLDLSNLKNLTRISVICKNLETLNLSECISIDTLFFYPGTLPSVKLIDLTNCVSLKKLFVNAAGNLENLILDGCNSLKELYCVNTKITQKITPFFSNLDVFDYSIRYQYNSWYKTYVDSGYGWWYEGEPERGYHVKK